jgi:hypothetical protein
MAEDVSPLRAGPEPLSSGASPVLVEPVLVEPGPDRRERARLSSYRLRFAAVYVVLATVLGVAAGVFLVLLMRPAAAAPEAWAAWQPDGRENQYPVEIADHVAAGYHLPSGRQLAGVLAGPAEVRDLPIRAVLIQHASSTPTREDDVEVVEIGSSVMYTFCGLGAQCSIAEGEPSASRDQLLRREALELALHTFAYVDGVDSVIALLPVEANDPADETDDSASAVFFQRDDFRAQLDAPLRETLGPPPLAGSDLAPSEATLVDRLTRRRTFLYEFQPTQDLGAILRFTPVVG